MPVKTNVIGGYAAYVAALGFLDLENPDQNQAVYSKWAGSVKVYPQIIKQKVCSNISSNLQTGTDVSFNKILNVELSHRYIASQNSMGWRKT